MLVADADVPFPVIRALKILQYPIATFDEIGAPVRPDKALMENVLRYSQVLVARYGDTVASLCSAVSRSRLVDCASALENIDS